MANIESKNLLVSVKSFARGNPLPLDKDETWESLEAAEEYIKSPTAYEGQTLKVLVDGKYRSYNVDKKEDGSFELTPVGLTEQETDELYVKANQGSQSANNVLGIEDNGDVTPFITPKIYYDEEDKFIHFTDWEKTYKNTFSIDNGYSVVDSDGKIISTPPSSQK